MALMPSTAPVVLNAQQEPHCVYSSKHTKAAALSQGARKKPGIEGIKRQDMRSKIQDIGCAADHMMTIQMERKLCDTRTARHADVDFIGVSRARTASAWPRAHLLLVLDLSHCVLLAPVDLHGQCGLVKVAMGEALQPVLRVAMELAVSQRVLLLVLFMAQIGQ
jgi:hypothetical protein